jgi:hypothetical protein
MVIIPRYVVNAKHFHNRFIGRKYLRNVVKGRRQGIQPRWHRVGVGAKRCWSSEEGEAD